MGSRLPATRWLYEDPEHPDRVTGTVSSPPYTPEDQALFMALRTFESQLCRCGYHRSIAWHPDMDGGWFEQRSYKCHACSAQKGEDVIYDVAADTRPGDDRALPPFELDDALVDGSTSHAKHGSKEVDASVG